MIRLFVNKHNDIQSFYRKDNTMKLSFRIVGLIVLGLIIVVGIIAYILVSPFLLIVEIERYYKKLGG